MRPSHFIAVALDSNDGYTWTLISRLGALLCEVENRYGSRDKTWTILGVEFGPENYPQLWYPRNCKHIAIQLSMNAIINEAIACYQLAHECIHLLSPSGGRNANVLEEGLATVFSEEYVDKEFGMKNVPSLPSYVHASSLVKKLLAIEPNAIKLLRDIEPSFTKITCNTFSQSGVNCSPEFIAELLAKFSRDCAPVIPTERSDETINEPSSPQ